MKIFSTLLKLQSGHDFHIYFQRGIHLPLFLRASTCRTVFRNQDKVGLYLPTALENTFVGLKGYMTK